MAIKDFIDNIYNPTAEFTALPFWFLNDELDKDILRYQIKSFNEKGINGFVLHPRIGLPNSLEYLSDEFMDYVKFIVKTAADNNMYVVLYDEGMYPSGSACGKVVEGNDDFKSRGLRICDNKSGKVIAKLSGGRYLCEVFSEGTIRGIHYGEDDGEANAPLAADILYPPAVEKFINLTHERYYAAVGEYFKTTIIGFFTDEPSVLGRCPDTTIKPWTKDFDKILTEKGCKLEELEGLFSGETNSSTKIYEREILKRECEVYYKSLYDWCENHGIKLMGHPHQSDDIELQQYFHIPGQDLVFRRVSPENGSTAGAESVQAKCSSDAAKFLGRKRNSNECFGVCGIKDNPWHLSGGDIKWFIDYLAVRGVNMFIPHAFYYSVRDNRKNERPPDVGMNNIWWKHYNYFADYMKRVSYLMTDIVNVAETAVLCENRNMPFEEVKELYYNQIEFNYLPKSVYNKLKSSQIGANNYKYFLTADSIREKAKDIRKRNITVDNADGLITTSFYKNNHRCIFAVNDKNATIDCNASIVGEGNVIACDLWNKNTYRVKASEQDGKLNFKLTLKPRESILFIITNEEIDIPQNIPKKYVKQDFTLVNTDPDNYVKEYKAFLEIQNLENNLYIKFNADEMAECYVNDKFAGVSFWNEHEFFISPMLKKGNNEIKIYITGSAANRFSDKKVSYGIIGNDSVRMEENTWK